MNLPFISIGGTPLTKDQVEALIKAVESVHASLSVGWNGLSEDFRVKTYRDRLGEVLTFLWRAHSP